MIWIYWTHPDNSRMMRMMNHSLTCFQNHQYVPGYNQVNPCDRCFFSGWIIRNYHQPNICIIDILPKSSQQSRLLNFKRKVLERPPYVECWGFLLFQSIGGFPNHPVTMTITSYVLRTMVTLGFENPTKYPQVSWIFMVYPQHIPTLMALNSYKWDYNSYN